ncbi:AGE family epimerase/isomerase [Roseiconus lacunae]|uniref:AGE family epimerase/isomerase n=1 Tax=Roseiconus lacunae TaxID=2605694 RepID=A0ABT7PHQ0_9BACT|nr:AGE family epimerase/isomerase [Roseiconus lacunae]MCD0461203.1 AGE family epimerase/isomerase [Roseiconus lacunae]MDM4016029.1 AGE family epimerase/isomerase [Roseiconus lacunae]
MKFDAERLNALITTYRLGLFEDTLPFWISHAVDHEHGGFMTCLDRDGTVIDTDKGVWQQGRFVWLLGELYNNVHQHRPWLELAQDGARFLEEYCVDRSDGRMWFQVTRDGKPIRKRRYAFSESFAAIAFGELAQATGEKRYANQAISCFERFVKHHTKRNQAESKFTAVRPTKSLAFPMITIATARQLLDSIGYAKADHWITRSLDEIFRHFLKAEIRCVMETVGENGDIIDHFEGRTLNPGHAIEAAWFVMREGELRQDQELIATGCRMLDWMWQRGWDQMHGGILYFVDVNGLPVQEYWHDMKFWWPQCEAIIATLMAYRLTGDAKYATWHGQIHDWFHQHFPDADSGECFGYLHRDGTQSSRIKGNLWKGPFHIPRMQLMCLQMLQPDFKR